MTRRAEDQQVLDNLEEWAEKIAEKIFIPETISVPDSVCCMAALKFVSRVSGRNRALLPKETIIKLLQNELDSVPDTTVKS